MIWRKGERFGGISGQYILILNILFMTKKWKNNLQWKEDDETISRTIFFLKEEFLYRVIEMWNVMKTEHLNTSLTFFFRFTSSHKSWTEEKVHHLRSFRTTIKESNIRMQHMCRQMKSYHFVTKWKSERSLDNGKCVGDGYHSQHLYICAEIWI